MAVGITAAMGVNASGTGGGSLGSNVDNTTAGATGLIVVLVMNEGGTTWAGSNPVVTYGSTTVPFVDFFQNPSGANGRFLLYVLPSPPAQSAGISYTNPSVTFWADRHVYAFLITGGSATAPISAYIGSGGTATASTHTHAALVDSGSDVAIDIDQFYFGNTLSVNSPAGTTALASNQASSPEKTAAVSAPISGGTIQFVWNGAAFNYWDGLTMGIARGAGASTVQGTATLAASASLVCAATVTEVAAAALVANAGLSTSGSDTEVAATTLPATATLTTSASSNPVTVRGTAGTTANSGASSVFLTVPTGTIDGDVMIALVGDVFSSGAAITPPAGWSAIAGSPLSPGGAMAGGMWYRIASGETAGTTQYTWTLGGTHKALGVIMSFAGVNNAQPFDNNGAAVAGVAVGTGTTSPSLPSDTSVTAGAMFVGGYVGRNSASGNTTNSTTVPTGFTKQADIQTTATTSVNGAATMMTQPAASPTTPSLAMTTSANNTYTAFLVALQPTVSAVTGSVTLASTATLSAVAVNTTPALATLAATSSLVAAASAQKLASATLAAAATLGATGTDPTNLFDDAASQSESGKGWSADTNCTTAQSSVQKRTGSFSTAVTASAAGEVIAYVSKTATVTPNNTLSVGFWLFPTVAGRTASISVDWKDASSAYLSSSVSPQTGALTANTWNYVSAVFTIPAGAPKATFLGRMQSAAAAEVVYYDDPWGSDTTANKGTLVAAASLTVAALVTTLASATLAATAALSSAGTAQKLAGATLAASAALTTAGTDTVFGVATLSATAALTANGGGILSGTATMTAAATLVSAGVISRLGTATFTAAGSLTTAGGVTAFGVTTLSASSALSTAGSVTVLTARTLAAAATLTTAGAVTDVAVVALAAAAALATSAQSSTTGSAALAAVSNLVTSSSGSGAGSVTLTATAALTAIGLLSRLGVATMAGTAALSTSGLAVQSGAATLSASSALSATAVLSRLGIATLAAAATLSSSGTITRFGLGTLAATASLSTTAGNTVVSAAALHAFAALASSSTVTVAAAALMPATSTVVAGGLVTTFAVAAFHADAQLSSVGIGVTFGLGTMHATATLTAFGDVPGRPNMNAFATLTVTAVIGRNGVVVMVAISTLGATGARGVVGGALLAAHAFMDVEGSVQRVGRRHTQQMQDPARLMTHSPGAQMWESGRLMSPA